MMTDEQLAAEHIRTIVDQLKDAPQPAYLFVLPETVFNRGVQVGAYSEAQVLSREDGFVVFGGGFPDQ